MIAEELQTQINEIAKSLTPEEALRLWATKGKTEETLRACYNRFVNFHYNKERKTKREQLLGVIQGGELSKEGSSFEGFIIVAWAMATAYFRNYDIVEIFWT